MYKENPKTKGSGIVCVIPQKEVCSVGCKECFFFRNGRSYLAPLEENLPNIPEVKEGKIYRINDGNDSSIDMKTVLKVAERFPMKFYNTQFSYNIDLFDAPVVLTVNGSAQVDVDFLKCDDKKIMFVRVLVNTWNFMPLATKAIMWYAEKGIPVVLTWMNYHKREDIPEHHRKNYERSVHVKNEYWRVKDGVWKYWMDKVKATNYAGLVESCGSPWGSLCKDCGNCLRFYFRKASELAKED